MRLEELQPDQSLEGLLPGQVATVVHVVPMGADARTVLFRGPDGAIKERLVTRLDEPALQLASASRPWSFSADGATFKLTTEARRIDLAWLFDPMMAVHTASVEPLPHQITAVYESMLPRQPLRFVLADDPGAGKTIMAGLYLRELLLRADARRILIVAPGSLVDQWREELDLKFGLDFRIFSRDLEQAAPGSNAFEDHPQLIVRLDQVARSADWQEKICAAGWDIVIFDEAHKLSAHFIGGEIKRTRRFEFAQKVGAATRHLLLMTATPHNGKEESFQLFLSLLDTDRFYGRFRDGVHQADTSDLMRRMVKEDLVRFDGTPLFPERRANTVNYVLSPEENELYERVTHYVKEQMGKADTLDGRRRGSVGFALTALQRRLASSPLAIYESLRRRHARLEERLREARMSQRGERGPSVLAPGGLQGGWSPGGVGAPSLGEDFDDDDLTAEQQEALEENLVDHASAAETVAELEIETLVLQALAHHARRIVEAGTDRKWEQLSQILQDNPLLHGPDNRLRKLIVFTEHRDTLNYLVQRIGNLLGRPDAIVTIHGGTPREQRLAVQERFWHEPEVRVLVATDAAGEGVNLQAAHLMVNYDLPWNPNRLEQRFGRIHRIGQTEVCHLWNLVAHETREGAVFQRLLDKIEVERAALDGRVFDILGTVFEGTSLRDLLIEAIRYGDDPAVRAQLHQRVDRVLDHDHLRSLLDRNALAQESLPPDKLFAVKAEMDKAEARRLQPYFVRAFFLAAFEAEGGRMHRREGGRYEITHVPQHLRDRDRQLTGRNRRDHAPVVSRYERVCFEKEAITFSERPGLPRAVLLHPGHPLLLALIDVVIERYGQTLRQGTILVDPTDDGVEPGLLLLITHEIRSGETLRVDVADRNAGAGGEARVVSKRMQFVRVRPDGSAHFAGWAPHLDLEPLDPAHRPLLAELLSAPWLDERLEQRALQLAASELVPAHLAEVSGPRNAHLDKTLAAVHQRLSQEIGFWSDRYLKLIEDAQAGPEVRMNLANVQRTLTDLETRLEQRKRALVAARHLAPATPAVVGAALVVPRGLLDQLRGGRPAEAVGLAVNLAARQRTERLAMEAVKRVERARGCTVTDVSAEKCGWDLTSQPPAPQHGPQAGRQPAPRHLEVKGRTLGADTITVTRNEILYALNQRDKFVLALVFVHPTEDRVDGPYYIREPFEREPDLGVASWNVEIKALLEKAEKVG